MKLYRDLNELPDPLRRGAITIGNFDGVHRGHVRIVERVIAKAVELRGPSIVFTFDPHPVRLLRPEMTPPPLSWTERKGELLGALGIEAVIVYPTDRELLSLTPREFFVRIVIGRLHARAVVEGQNFFFGKGRAGDVHTLSQLCQEYSVSLELIQPMNNGDGHVVISSSLVRSMISEGRIEEANRMLTEPYRIRGRVTRGAGRGAAIGFPTANLDQIDTLAPGPGVYAGRAYVRGGVFDAAINVGSNPTFGESDAKVEVHLLDFSAPIYSQHLEVEFRSRLREIQKFANVEELCQQLRRDVEIVRRQR